MRCLLLALLVAGALAGLVNKNVFRAIDIQGETVYIRMNVTLENPSTATDTHSVVRIPIEYDQKKLSMFYATSAGSALTSSFDESDKSYLVTLKEPLRPGKTVQFSVLIVLTHAVRPSPARITQGASQLVKYLDNHYFYSPYPTKEQTLHITTHGDKLEEYSKLNPTFAQGANLVCGPYRDIEPLSHHDLMVHFDDNVPFVTATNIVKEMVISHWDGVWTKEHYWMKNTGAELDGFFSRYDMQIRRVISPSAIMAMRCSLPVASFDINYRDDIGNISTSAVNYTATSVDLDIAPRFLLFGGWKIDFQVEFKTPLGVFALPESERQASKGKYQIGVQVAPTMSHATTDKIELRVALPEGASNIAVEAPAGVSWEMSPVPTYALLDLIGRPTVVLRATNVVSSLSPQVKISYDYNTSRLLLKPAICVGYFVALCAIVYMAARFCAWVNPKQQKAARSHDD